MFWVFSRVSYQFDLPRKENLQDEAPRSHPYQMPKPSQLAPYCQCYAKENKKVNVTIHNSIPLLFALKVKKTKAPIYSLVAAAEIKTPTTLLCEAV